MTQRRSPLLSLFASPHAFPLLALGGLILLYWSRVLVTQQVLLPGEFLRGFAPFGSDAQAPWNILQWDALGQYYPWRLFAARELQAGHIPLWNPHQFAGTPFVANGQSAVFYPLNLPFWIMDVARAFGVSACLHTFLAAFGTYFLCQQWQRSRAASLLAAIAFGFCGYLTAWVMLPTLANTASWIPLLLLLFERATAIEYSMHGKASNPAHTANPTQFAWFALALCCALLAGHAQIFFYCLVALALRTLTMPQPLYALRLFAGGALLAGALAALQLLPTLELSRISHRAGQSADASGWNFVREHALQTWQLPSLLDGGWLSASWDENKGTIGVAMALLAAVALVVLGKHVVTRRSVNRHHVFAAALTIFGLLYALGTPLSQAFYFGVPGLSQMGGVGRALILWSLGAALLAAFAVDALAARWKSPALPALALLIVTAELFATTWNRQPTAPRETIYPRTRLTAFLQEHTRDGSRVLIVTPRPPWLPTEALLPAGRNHPPGVLPPNGALVYGLHDVSGYDSLALRKYREFVSPGEILTPRDPTISPSFNGNMVLLTNAASPALDALNVRYVVALEAQPPDVGRLVLQADNCFVYERRVPDMAQPRVQRSGRDFAPGWRQGQYQPQSFRIGTFISLCALTLVAALFAVGRKNLHGL